METEIVVKTVSDNGKKRYVWQLLVGGEVYAAGWVGSRDTARQRAALAREEWEYRKTPDGDSGFRLLPGAMCRNCKSKDVYYRVWESADGAHEDDHYRCFACQHEWWVDGPDA